MLGKSFDQETGGISSIQLIFRTIDFPKTRDNGSQTAHSWGPFYFFLMLRQMVKVKIELMGEAAQNNKPFWSSKSLFFY
ncbi:MAG: hypothetical protein ACRD3F_14980 [Acidobacteriaceae bacterium]